MDIKELKSLKDGDTVILNVEKKEEMACMMWDFYGTGKTMCVVLNGLIYPISEFDIRDLEKKVVNLYEATFYDKHDVVIDWFTLDAKDQMDAYKKAREIKGDEYWDSVNVTLKED